MKHIEALRHYPWQSEPSIQLFRAGSFIVIGTGENSSHAASALMVMVGWQVTAQLTGSLVKLVGSEITLEVPVQVKCESFFIFILMLF